MNTAQCNFDAGDCCGPNANTDYCISCQCLSGYDEITSSSQRKGVAFGFNLIGNAHRIGYRINGSCVTKESVSRLLDFVLSFAIYFIMLW